MSRGRRLVAVLAGLVAFTAPASSAYSAWTSTPATVTFTVSPRIAPLAPPDGLTCLATPKGSKTVRLTWTALPGLTYEVVDAATGAGVSARVSAGPVQLDGTTLRNAKHQLVVRGYGESQADSVQRVEVQVASESCVVKP